MQRSELDKIYDRSMRNTHPYGSALYQPLPNTSFRPASCGYFDQFGYWNPIAHFCDPASLDAAGLSPVQEVLEKAPSDSSMSWGPKVCKNTKGRKVDVSASLDGSSVGIPVGASVTYSFSSQFSSGAVLLTTPPITHERYYHESPFINWAKENSAEILKKRPEVQRYGMWIITSTHATRKCTINAWNQAGKDVKVSFKVNAVSVGECGPSGEWFEDQESEGWNRFEAKEPDEKLVVFFRALKFRYNKILFKNLKSLSLERTYYCCQASEEYENYSFVMDIPFAGEEGDQEGDGKFVMGYTQVGDAAVVPLLLQQFFESLRRRTQKPGIAIVSPDTEDSTVPIEDTPEARQETDFLV